jgi:hypothetical protein
VPPLTDPDRLAAYRDALGNWKFADYVRFTGNLNEEAHRFIRRALGITERELGRLMHDFVAAGGKIDEVVETRPGWAEYKFHYDLRFTIRNKPVYIETRFELDTHYRLPVVPDESWIEVVNIHEQ